MTTEMKEMLEDAIDRRAAINDFQNYMNFKMLRIAGEQGADDEIILDQFGYFVRKSAGK